MVPFASQKKNEEVSSSTKDAKGDWPLT